MFYRTRKLSHCRNSMKNCLPTQNFTEIKQSAVELWPKKDFQYGGHPPSWMLWVQEYMSLKSLCRTCYLSSIEVIALNCLVFEKIVFCTHFDDRQSDRQTAFAPTRKVAFAVGSGSLIKFSRDYYVIHYVRWQYGWCVWWRVIQVWAAGAMPGNASPNDIESNQSSWGIGANITTKLINQTGEVRTASITSHGVADVVGRLVGWSHGCVVEKRPDLWSCHHIYLGYLLSSYTKYKYKYK